MNKQTTEQPHFAKYQVHFSGVLKDGHTMFIDDVVTDLNRKSFLEAEVIELRRENAELEKELDSALYFNIDVIRCLSKIAWEHNHDEIPAYMNLAKECIEKIELKQVKALEEQGE
jgi:hypothetical protein